MSVWAVGHVMRAEVGHVMRAEVGHAIAPVDHVMTCNEQTTLTKKGAEVHVKVMMAER